MAKTLVCLLVAVSVLALFGCDVDTHEHTFEYVQYEETHFKQYTCGCPSPDIAELHSDNNSDNICDKCEKLLNGKSDSANNINTADNYTFFPTEKSDLHREELIKVAQAYFDEHSDLYGVGEVFEVFSLISVADSERYGLDIFQVKYEEHSFYLAKHGDNIYHLTTFPKSNEVSHSLTHLAITDINDDGHIEILVSSNSVSVNSDVSSNVKIIDTRTGLSVYFFDYDNNLIYFKENEDGIISLYNTEGNAPKYTEAEGGGFAEKYYEFATNLFDTPVLNTVDFNFSEYKVTAACELYSVEIEIMDDDIKFPYLLESVYPPKSFSIKVKMTYLGESFQYVNGTSYVDGATVSFINADNQIDCEGWGEFEVVTTIGIGTGAVIEHTYDYKDYPCGLFASGVYDMVITYENEHVGIKESIVIENFLELTR